MDAFRCEKSLFFILVTQDSHPSLAPGFADLSQTENIPYNPLLGRVDFSALWSGTLCGPQKRVARLKNKTKQDVELPVNFRSTKNHFCNATMSYMLYFLKYVPCNIWDRLTPKVVRCVCEVHV